MSTCLFFGSGQNVSQFVFFYTTKLSIVLRLFAPPYEFVSPFMAIGQTQAETKNLLAALRFVIWVSTANISCCLPMNIRWCPYFIRQRKVGKKWKLCAAAIYHTKLLALAVILKLIIVLSPVIYLNGWLFQSKFTLFYSIFCNQNSTFSELFCYSILLGVRPTRNFRDVTY
jgi:hypothetical protein